MKYVNLILATLCTLTVGATTAGATRVNSHAAQPPRPMDPTAVAIRELRTVNAVGDWMANYYKSPTPELLVPALLIVDKNDLLHGDSGVTMQAFASRVFAAHPERLKDWFAKMDLLSDSGKTLILTSIWWSNTKEGKELLTSIAQALPDPSKTEFQKQIDSDPPPFEKMEIESPIVVDMMWAAFCATGDTKYVKHMMTALPWEKTETKDLTKVRLAQAARWSLASNILLHEKVKQFCDEIIKTDKDLKPFVESAEADSVEMKKRAELKAAKANGAKDSENTSSAKSDTDSVKSKKRKRASNLVDVQDSDIDLKKDDSKKSNSAPESSNSAASKVVDGQDKGKDLDANVSQSKNPGDKVPESKDPDSKDPNSKGAGDKDSEIKGSESKDADGKVPENKVQKGN